jgi:hypothetical protein
MRPHKAKGAVLQCSTAPWIREQETGSERCNIVGDLLTTGGHSLLQLNHWIWRLCFLWVLPALRDKVPAVVDTTSRLKDAGCRMQDSIGRYDTSGYSGSRYLDLAVCPVRLKKSTI